MTSHKIQLVAYGPLPKNLKDCPKSDGFVLSTFSGSPNDYDLGYWLYLHFSETTYIEGRFVSESSYEIAQCSDIEYAKKWYISHYNGECGCTH